MTAAPIFDTDPDAIKKLGAKLAGLDSERDRIKAYNKSCKAKAKAAAKAGETHNKIGDLNLLDKTQQADLLACIRHSPHGIGANGEFPSYVLSNLGGNVTRVRERLARLERQRDRLAATPIVPDDRGMVRVYEPDAEPYDFTPEQAERLVAAGFVYRDEDGVYWQRPGVTFGMAQRVADAA